MVFQVRLFEGLACSTCGASEGSREQGWDGLGFIGLIGFIGFVYFYRVLGFGV